MIYSKVTEKFQATIPKEIRTILKLQAGDKIVFEVLKDKSIKIKKSRPFDEQYAKALSSTLNEWESENDEKAYRNL